MGRLVRAAAAVLALAIGGGVAYVTRSAPPGRANARPPAVERVVKALDRFLPGARELASGTREELAAALAAAGRPSGLASPGREEVELAALVLAGDRAAIEAFANAGAPSPARARAWLRLALDGPDGDRRAAALEALETRYPDSAAARVFGVRPTAAPK